MLLVKKRLCLADLMRIANIGQCFQYIANISSWKKVVLWLTKHESPLYMNGSCKEFLNRPIGSWEIFYKYWLHERVTWDIVTPRKPMTLAFEWWQFHMLPSCVVNIILCWMLIKHIVYITFCFKTIKWIFEIVFRTP